MPARHVCPCCDGHGVSHDLRGGDFETLLECVECDGRGHVTREHRAELLAWRERCRAVRDRGRESGRNGAG